MAARNNPAALRIDYSDNDAGAAFFRADAFDENLTNIGIRRENERGFRRLRFGETCR